MSIVNKKYEEAVHFFHELEKNNFDQSLYEFNLSAFINSTRNISYAIQKDGKNKPLFEEWWENIRQIMRDDELMRFFYKLRNFSIKEADNKIATQNGLQIRHTLSFDGKGGCIATIKSRDGQNLGKKTIKSDPTAEFFIGGIGISLNSGLWEKIYFFDKIDNLKLKYRTISSITDLCFDYMIRMKSIVNEYLDKFN